MFGSSLKALLDLLTGGKDARAVLQADGSTRTVVAFTIAGSAVFTPAANANGCVIHRAQIAGSNAGQYSLHLGITSQSAGGEGNFLSSWNVTEPWIDNVFVLAGTGLWERGSVNANRYLVSYTLL